MKVIQVFYQMSKQMSKMTQFGKKSTKEIIK